MYRVLEECIEYQRNVYFKSLRTVKSVYSFICKAEFIKKIKNMLSYNLPCVQSFFLFNLCKYDDPLGRLMLKHTIPSTIMLNLLLKKYCFPGKWFMNTNNCLIKVGHSSYYASL